MNRSLAKMLAAVAVFVAAPLHAQTGIFLDRSYIVRMWPEDGLLYEGQPAIPIYLHNGLDSLYSGLLDPVPRWSSGTALVLTPLFRIRQLSAQADPSLPVHTPSFMPKLTWQYIAARRIGDPLRHRPELPISAMVFGIEETFGHYSNGQAGCFRANEVRKAADSGDCVINPSAGPGSDTLNTVDGSFSTWYFRTLLNLRFVHYRDIWPLFTFTVSAGVDWHPAFLQPIGGMDTALAAVYGRLRPFGGMELTRRSEWPCAPTWVLAWLPCGAGRARIGSAVEFLATRPSGISAVATTSELAWTFDRYAGIGPLLRLHTGQDYYNMALGHELNVFQFGLVFDLERDVPLTKK